MSDTGGNETDINFYVTGCDRCGHRGWNVQVRPELPCCPVPLCDRCAALHRAEVAEEKAEQSGWAGEGR